MLIYTRHHLVPIIPIRLISADSKFMYYFWQIKTNCKALQKTSNFAMTLKFDVLRSFKLATVRTEYTHRESNPNRRNRNPLFYPLNYGCSSAFAILKKQNFGGFAFSVGKSNNIFVALQIQ